MYIWNLWPNIVRRRSPTTVYHLSFISRDALYILVHIALKRYTRNSDLEQISLIAKRRYRQYVRRVIVAFKFRRSGCYTHPVGYILLGAWQIQRCHLAFIRERSKCAFPIYKRASPLSTLRIRVRASKHELPTIAAHTIPSSIVNQGGIRVRAIVKVSNKFRRASSSSRESRRVIRKIDFPGMHRMSGPVKI